MRQRAELIQQIRALESVPIDRWKPVDLTSVAGHGVHDEMSIAELRERLELVKLERAKERDQRRDLIVKDKQSKEQLITSTVQNIVKYRNELTSQAAMKSVHPHLDNVGTTFVFHSKETTADGGIVEYHDQSAARAIKADDRSEKGATSVEAAATTRLATVEFERLALVITTKSILCTSSSSPIDIVHHAFLFTCRDRTPNGIASISWKNPTIRHKNVWHRR